MRTYRRNHQCIDFGNQDRPTRRQRISGRSRWRRHNHPIRSKSGGQLVIYFHYKMPHARDGALSRHHIVQGLMRAIQLAVAPKLAVQHRSGLNATRPLVPGLKMRVNIREPNLGQEAERPQIDAQNRHPAAREHPRCRQQRPIAPQNDHQLRIQRRQLRTRVHLFICHVVRAHRVQQRIMPVRFQPQHQLRQQLPKLILLRFRDDRDARHAS